MFTPAQKIEISARVQRILQDINNDELPSGEINFILHVDGEADWSWANIRNFSARDIPVPQVLVRNLTAK
jgi:hypothetical protein